MKQNKQFDNILNECLDRVFHGETVEDCLRRYPDQASELEPLLRTAVAARTAAQVQPRSEFKAKARYEFMSAVHEKQARKTQRWSFLAPVFGWQKGWAIAIIVGLVVVLGGGGTMVAAADSMPDSPLYGVKLVTEQAQLAVTPSDIGKAELNAKFADRRANEIAYMAGKDNIQEVQIAAQRMTTNLENMTNLALKDSPNNQVQGVGTYNSDSSAHSNGVVSSNDNTNRTVAVPAPMLQAAPAAPAPAAAPMPQPVQTPAPATSAPPALMAPKAAPATTDQSGTGSASSEASSGAGGGPAPSISVAVPPMAPKVAPHNNSNNANNANVRNHKTVDQEKLKQIIIDNFNKRQARLEAALEKASPNVRPAIRQALANSQVEFEKALQSLDQDNFNR